METVIKVTQDEFTHALVDKIKAFLKDRKNFEITINVKEKTASDFLFQEPPEEYIAQLNQSISDIENNRDLISLTVEEFEKLAASLEKR
jgi:hypothetical protein